MAWVLTVNYHREEFGISLKTNCGEETTINSGIVWGASYLTSSITRFSRHMTWKLWKKWQNSPWKYEDKLEDALNLNNGRCVLLSSAVKYFSNGLESLGHWETLNCPVKNIFLNHYQLRAAAAKCSEQRKKIKGSHQQKCAFLLVSSV